MRPHSHRRAGRGRRSVEWWRREDDDEDNGQKRGVRGGGGESARAQSEDGAFYFYTQHPKATPTFPARAWSMGTSSADSLAPPLMAPYLATSRAVSLRLSCSLSRRSPSHLAPASPRSRTPLGQHRVSFADAVNTAVGTSVLKRTGKRQTLIL